MFTRAFRLATLRGVDVRLDLSLVVIALLVAWTFATRFTGSHGTAVGWLMAVTGAVLFFASILAHEFGHALEARHRGIHVHGITLFLFGGVTEMEAHGHRPRDELMIAAIGPWISLVCGAAFGLVATLAQALPDGWSGPVGDVAGTLGWINVALAVFNLVPGAPLDGGRVLRALLWWATGDRLRAVRMTSWAGQALGAGLAVFGLWVIARTGTAGIAALWYVVIGLFLHGAARRELRGARLEALYTDWSVERLVADIDRRGMPTLAVDAAALSRVDAAADLHTLVDAFQDGRGAVVVERDGQPVTVLLEREVAAAIARLRRQPRQRGAAPSPAQTS